MRFLVGADDNEKSSPSIIHTMNKFLIYSQYPQRRIKTKQKQKPGTEKNAMNYVK